MLSRTDTDSFVADDWKKVRPQDLELTAKPTKKAKKERYEACIVMYDIC